MDKLIQYLVVFIIWQLVKYIYRDFKSGGNSCNEKNMNIIEELTNAKIQKNSSGLSNQIEWNKQDYYFECAQHATDVNLFATAATFYSKAIQINPHHYYYMLRAYSNSMAFNL